MVSGKIWTVHDRYGNEIYLTWERWMHIVDPDNHPEIESFSMYLAETIRLGQRRQDVFDANSYQYYRAFSELPGSNTHLVVCVRFRWRTLPDGSIQDEKFVTTAYFQFF